MFHIYLHMHTYIYKQYILKYFRRDNYYFGVMFFLFVLTCIIVCMWKFAIWVNNFTISVPLSQIFITGERFYTTANDIRQSILSLGSIGTFMTQDISLIQKNIKNLSWIKQVSVRKQWPNKIKIHIVEYIPIACWNGTLYLDSDAVFFSLPVEHVVSTTLPVLFGPEGSEKHVLSAYYIFNKVLKCIELEVKSLSMNIRYSWRITLQNDIQLILGYKDNVEQLKRFIKFYPIFLKEFIDRNHENISYIDLRYKSGFSIGTS